MITFPCNSKDLTLARHSLLGKNPECDVRWYQHFFLVLQVAQLRKTVMSLRDA